MGKVSLALVIHSHQPVGNFDHVIEESYQKSYSPFLQVLEAHPAIRLSLHYSGILLEWLEGRHPEFLERLRQLVGRGQIELMGGGFFEPILPAIPDRDKGAQIEWLRDYLRQHFGVTPKGAWLAERVWEPSLARPLSKAGVHYTVLDDTHFLAAGLELDELHGYYLTEEAGLPLRLVPSLKALRYSIPFREPEETLRILGEGRGRRDALYAMGDDCEKFGTWPGTYDHCYTNGWLERFLTMLEASDDWLETTTVSDYLAAHSPVGRIYLPTASYAEMMEWALPASASGEYRACLEETERMPSGERFRRFLRGGFWRNFLAKYPESNQIHKLMLEVSRAWHSASSRTAKTGEGAGLLGEAQRHLLAAQCNDAYWHGVFGGLYAPHLRSALLRHLVQAESRLDRLQSSAAKPLLRITSRDFDLDGHEEILLHEPTFGMVVRPDEGGTVSSLRFKPADVELMNSLGRRPEAYHELVRRHAASPEPPREGPASIHHLVLSKELNLDSLLRYDRYPRHAFRTYIFPAAKEWQDFEHLRLEENEDLARGAWTLVAPGAAAAPGTIVLRREACLRSSGQELEVSALKTLSTRAAAGRWQLECRSSLSAQRSSPMRLALGVELVLNLLAPDAPDRYLLADQVRRPLEFRGEIRSPRLLLVDEWQGVRIALEGEPQPRWWMVPIETISQSESGFERVYQGSAILAVWKVDSPAWRNIACTLRAEVSQVEPRAGLNGPAPAAG